MFTVYITMFTVYIKMRNFWKSNFKKQLTPCLGILCVKKFFPSMGNLHKYITSCYAKKGETG